MNDYLNPDNEEDFNYLLTYSPLHNIPEKEYPAVFTITGDHDDRVVPWHSYKYIARLQKENKSSNPKLLWIKTDQGHGAGMSKNNQVEEMVKRFSFLEIVLGMEFQ